MASLSFIQTSASYNLCIPVNRSQNFWSRPVTIQGVQFKFNIEKLGDDDEAWLTVFLHREKNDETRDWPIAATFTVRLLSSNGEVNSVECTIGPIFYDCERLGFGTVKFIKWNELFDDDKKYVQDDMLYFNVKVDVADLNSPNASKLLVNFNRSCDKSREITLQLTLNNVDNLMAVRTQEFSLQDLRLNVTVLKSTMKYLGLRLTRINGTEGRLRYVKISFEMKSSIKGARNIKKSWRTRLRNPTLFESIIKWDDLFKPENGFVINNSVSFEVNIEVDELEEAGPSAKKHRPNHPNTN